MGLETVTYIPELNQSNPVGATDPKSEGDDHLRLIKKSLLNTFGSFVGTAGVPKSVTLTEDQINDASQKAANETIAGDKTLTGFLRTDDSTTTRAGLRIPTGVAPTSPVEGDVWKLSDDLLIYLDGVVTSLVTAGGQLSLAWAPPDSGVSLLNQSAALLFFANNSSYRSKMDLSQFTDMRMISHVLVAGAAASFHETRYFTSFASGVGSYLEMGTSPIRNDHDTAPVIEDTGWIPLVSGAKIDNCFMALVMDDGDNTADPQVEQCICYFR